MKAALQKSARDAQVRDSFNKESYIQIKSEGVFRVVEFLNKMERVTPRNATKLHTALVTTDGQDQMYIINFEVLEAINAGFRLVEVSSLQDVTVSVSTTKTDGDLDNNDIKEDNSND